MGISIEGEVEFLGSNVSKDVAKSFQSKLNKKDELMEAILNSTNPHKFYVLKPTRITLFDNKTFPDEPKKVLEL